MYNSFPELTSKYRMDVSRVLSLLNSDVFDITLTLYISVSCAGLLTRVYHIPVFEEICIFLPVDVILHKQYPAYITGNYTVFMMFFIPVYHTQVLYV